MRAETDAIEKAEAGAAVTTFADSIKMPTAWGNAEAAAYHRFKGFVSAVVTDAKMSDAVKTSLTNAIATGQSFRDWQKGIGKVFEDAGFSKISPKSAERIYRTETSLAYGAGSYASLLEVSDRFPYWEFTGPDDERKRDSHRALLNKVFKTGDKQYWPPLGYNCRDRAAAISKRRAAAKGITGPDTVTPEMRANLKDAEFIGDKIKSFEDYVAEKVKTLDATRAQMIADKLAELLKSKPEPITPTDQTGGTNKTP